MALLADHLRLNGWLAMPYLNIDLLKYNDYIMKQQNLLILCLA